MYCCHIEVTSMSSSILLLQFVHLKAFLRGSMTGLVWSLVSPLSSQTWGLKLYLKRQISLSGSWDALPQMALFISLCGLFPQILVTLSFSCQFLFDLRDSLLSFSSPGSYFPGVWILALEETEFCC